GAVVLKRTALVRRTNGISNMGCFVRHIWFLAGKLRDAYAGLGRVGAYSSAVTARSVSTAMTNGTNPLWHFHLFGGLRARPRSHDLGASRERTERLVTRFRTQSTGALLDYLAYNKGRSHPREVLIELLWPDSARDSGRHNLSNALSSLRNQLEPPGVPAGAVIIADRLTVEL